MQRIDLRLPAFLPIAAVYILAAALLHGQTSSPATPPSSGQSATTPDGQASLVKVPDEVPKEATRYTMLLAGNKAGVLATWTTADGARHSFYEFNDRGRGPRLLSRETFDKAGVPSSLDITGHDYLKAPVEERFSFDGHKAAWNNKSEQGEKVLASPAFYVSGVGSPGETESLVAALLAARGKKMDLLPEGEASIERVGERKAQADGQSVDVVHYEISGLDFTPDPVWLTKDGKLFASGAGWFVIIREGWDSAWPALNAAQEARSAARGVELAKKAARKPYGALVFVHANLFDSEAAVSRANTTVVIQGNKIESVGPDGSIKIPPGATVIDAKGKALLPGLWDMHVHLGGDDGVLHIAAGVTSVRDMANDIDQVGELKRKYDAVQLVGPRVINAGFIDGRGPYQGPTKVFADTPEEARADIEKYKSLGYEQIKVYSSLKPELVAGIAEEAHKRGMRLSGHVPAFMTAEQFVRAGADEIQHINFIFLNFFFDQVQDTRTPARFTAVAQHAAELDLGSDRVKNFIALLKEHHTVVDPTVAIFEGQFLVRDGVLNPIYAPVASRMPAQIRRGFLGGGLPVPEGPAGIETDRRFRDSAAALLKMVKLLYDTGVTIVAGTDDLAGFTLHRELEYYVEAGIPAPKVLQIATLGGARVMKHDNERGSIAPGKLADVILVDGDPATRISDIRHVVTVVKDGVIYDPAALYESLGVKPQ
jgi:imidazolonepropionase-like amidohydrolase